MNRRISQIVLFAFILCVASLVFGFSVFAEAPAGEPAGIVWTGSVKHPAGQPWSQSGLVVDKASVKVSMDGGKVVFTIGQDVVTTTVKNGEFAVSSTTVFTKAGEISVKAVYSATVLYDGKSAIQAGATDQVKVTPSDSDYSWWAGEGLRFKVSAVDKFDNAIGVPSGQAIWYRIDLPVANPIVVSRPYTQSLPATTDVVSTTKVGLLGIAACVDGKCASYQHQISAAEVVSLTVNAPMTVTTGSKFEVVSKGVDQYGNTSGEQVKYEWKSADSNGDLFSVRPVVVINAGNVTGTMAVRITVGRVVAGASVAVIEKATSGASAAWKAIPAAAMSDEVKPGATLKVVSGMTYWELAAKAYGNGSLWQKIAGADATPGLQIGESIAIPAI